MCLKGYKSKLPIKILPVCYHTLHMHCANDWFKLNSNCPSCRSPVGPDEISEFKARKETEEILLQKIRDARFENMETNASH